VRILRVADAAGQVAARVRSVVGVARERSREHAGVRDHDVVLADAKLLAAERTDGDGNAARKARLARRLRDALAIVGAIALGGAEAVVALGIHRAHRQLATERHAQARARHAVERR
jgi:hypothetical protein